MALLAIDWTALGTLALAGVGLVTLIVNVFLVLAAHEQAKASAATVEEMRRDRALELQPFIIFET
jgi:hypothetical protein